MSPSDKTPSRQLRLSLSQIFRRRSSVAEEISPKDTTRKESKERKRPSDPDHSSRRVSRKKSASTLPSSVDREGRTEVLDSISCRSAPQRYLVGFTPCTPSKTQRSPYGWYSDTAPTSIPQERRDTRYPSLSLENEGKGKRKAMSALPAADELAHKLEQMALQGHLADVPTRLQSRKHQGQRPASKRRAYFSHTGPLPDVRLPITARGSSTSAPPARLSTRPSFAESPRMESIAESQAASTRPIVTLSSQNVSPRVADRVASSSITTAATAPIPEPKSTTTTPPTKVSLLPLLSASGSSNSSYCPSEEVQSCFDIPDLKAFGTAPTTAATTAPNSLDDRHSEEESQDEK